MAAIASYFPCASFVDIDIRRLLLYLFIIYLKIMDNYSQVPSAFILIVYTHYTFLFLNFFNTADFRYDRSRPFYIFVIVQISNTLVYKYAKWLSVKLSHSPSSGKDWSQRLFYVRILSINIRYSFNNNIYFTSTYSFS